MCCHKSKYLARVLTLHHRCRDVSISVYYPWDVIPSFLPSYTYESVHNNLVKDFPRRSDPARSERHLFGGS
jgi:hypothetical protein